METVGDHVAVNNKASFKSHEYLPVIENMISAFERRFDTAQLSVMRDIQPINPASEHFLDVAYIKPFAEAYNTDIIDLQHELYQAKRLIERATIDYESNADAAICEKPPTSPVSFTAFIVRCDDAFHELHQPRRICNSTTGKHCVL